MRYCLNDKKTSESVITWSGSVLLYVVFSSAIYCFVSSFGWVFISFISLNL